MNRQFDEAIKNYYSVRRKPSQEIKNKLHEKLIIAMQRRETKWCWLILAYAFFFTMVTAFALLIFTNNEIIVLMFMSNFILSFFINVIIIFFCRNVKEKGGNEIGIIYD